MVKRHEGSNKNKNTPYHTYLNLDSFVEHGLSCFFAKFNEEIAMFNEGRPFIEYGRVDGSGPGGFRVSGSGPMVRIIRLKGYSGVVLLMDKILHRFLIIVHPFQTLSLSIDVKQL